MKSFSSRGLEPIQLLSLGVNRASFASKVLQRQTNRIRHFFVKIGRNRVDFDVLNFLRGLVVTKLGTAPSWYFFWKAGRHSGTFLNSITKVGQESGSELQT